MGKEKYVKLVETINPADLGQHAAKYLHDAGDRLSRLSAAERKKLEEAEARASSDPRSAERIEEYAQLLERSGDINRQVAALKEACHVAPERGWSWIKLGNALEFQGKWMEAISAYREVLRLPLAPKPPEGPVRSAFRSAKMFLSLPGALRSSGGPGQKDGFDSFADHLKEETRGVLHTHWLQFACTGIIRCAVAAGDMDLARITAKQLTELERIHLAWWRKVF